MFNYFIVGVTVCYHKGAWGFAACNRAVKQNTSDGTTRPAGEVALEKLAFRG